MSLKTLKEIKNDDDAADEKYVERYAVEQEAIKWMKWINKDFDNTEHPGLKSYEEKCIGLSACHEMLKKFFNIEESDLK